MTEVFADASFYIAFINPRDSLHVAARRFGDSYDGNTITSDYVLTEVANFLANANQRSQFESLMTALRNDRQVEIIRSMPDLWERGYDLYARRPDKNWSLTDCISFVVMQERGLTDALTADHHFEQAGFTVLLS